MRASHGDRGEVDIIGPSEGLVASSILAGRTKNTEKPVVTRVDKFGLIRPDWQNQAGFQKRQNQAGPKTAQPGRIAAKARCGS